jgi:hypothetical protein
MYLIQVDAAAHEPEIFDENTKVFCRKASGGTYLYPAIEKAKECFLEYDVIVIITDGGCESSWDDIPTVPVIWLCTTNTLNFDIKVGDMQSFRIGKNK